MIRAIGHMQEGARGGGGGRRGMRGMRFRKDLELYMHIIDMREGPSEPQSPTLHRYTFASLNLWVADLKVIVKGIKSFRLGSQISRLSQDTPVGSESEGITGYGVRCYSASMVLGAHYGSLLLKLALSLVHWVHLTPRPSRHEWPHPTGVIGGFRLLFLFCLTSPGCMVSHTGKDKIKKGFGCGEHDLNASSHHL